MGVKLGSAYGKVGLDASGLLRAVKQGKASLQSLAAVGQQVGGALQGVGKTLTLGLTAPILALSGASINMASDFDEALSKSNNVFESFGESVESNAAKAYKSLGLGKKSYLDYVSSIGAALKSGGMAIDESTKLSERAIKHIVDLRSFHNGNVQQIADAWQSAYRGQYEPIQRYFSFVNNEFMLSYGKANSLIDQNTKKLTANQRAIILDAIALDENLNPAIDDFAETSGGLANQAEKTKALMENLSIMWGQNLLPIALDLTMAINDMFERFNNMPPALQKTLVAFAAFLAVLGPVITGVGSLISGISTITGFVGSLTGASISLAGIGTAATGAAAGLGSFLVAAAPVILMLIAIAAGLWFLYDSFKNHGDEIKRGAQVMWAAMKKFFGDGWKGIKEMWGEGTAWLEESWSGFMERNEDRMKKWGESLQNTWQKILDYFAQARQRIADIFQNVDWGTIGKNVLWGIANGMLLGIPALVKAAVDSARATMNAFDNELDINSPSGEGEKRGIFWQQGVMNGIRKVTAEDLANVMTQPFRQSNTTYQTQQINMQLGGGLTVRQAQAMIAQSEERIMASLTQALRSV